MGQEVVMTKKRLKSHLKELENQKIQTEAQYQQILGAISVTSKYIDDFDAEPVSDAEKEKK